MRNRASTLEASREARLRGRARRLGFRVRKSRAKHSTGTHGGYMLVNDYLNAIVAGGRFDLNLDELEYLLTEIEARA